MLEQTQAQSFPFSGDLFPVVAPVQWETFFLFLINLLIFIFGCIGSSLLCGFFSSCSKQGLLCCSMQASLVAEHGLYGPQGSLVAECGLGSCGSWALDHRLNNCGTRA